MILISGNDPGLLSKSAGLVGALLPRELGLGGLRISDKSWPEMAAERRCTCPLLGGGLTGANVGDGRPPSDLVGLVLMTVMDSPVLTFPPTNSLPNLRCPCRAGMVRGVIGETGGLNRELSEDVDAPGLKEKSGRAEGPDCASEGLVAAAPGLKLKSGSAEARDERKSAGSSLISKCCTGSSTTDLGRRPAALENDEDADEEGRAGNTKGGFGGGRSRREESCELEKCDVEGIDLSKGVGIMMGCVAPFGPPIAALSTALLAAYRVAIFFKAAPRHRIGKQLNAVGYHRVSSAG